ncbi:E3 ubiquitin-protein ligase TRIM58-like [Denticeps clupeoides]|uniref:E3 ubiquitin-protein ligase TRIM58-like n=1 Tax=Denticeps clupeoides TaxID=299321 RepID=UPI0010A4588F|nr:E3 ubiquitin-protein ligase TRIM58-like [Denticeps clupeoides]
MDLVLNLDEDLLCAVCRDIFTEPVTLPCGHNYCEGCVAPLKRTPDGGQFACPLCLAPCDAQLRLRRNGVLRGIVEKYRRRGRAGAGLLCPRHGERLELYCHTDGAALCACCMLPSEAAGHADGHRVARLADAVTELQEACQRKLCRITDSLSEVEGSLSNLECVTSCSKKNREDRQKEYSTFLHRIRLFLELEENAWCKRLSVDQVQESLNVKKQFEKLLGLKKALVQAQESLREVLTIQDPLALLKTSKNAEWTDLYEACARHVQEASMWKGIRPAASVRIMPLFHNLQMAFAGDNIMLDPKTAHPSLRLDPANSLLCLKEEKDTMGCMGPYSVLAQVAFSHGVHHWEVEVENLHMWTVGILSAPKQGESHPWVLCSEDQFWGLSYTQNSRQYCAKHAWQNFSFSSPSAGLPQRVGLFLDVESGILSFYNAVELGHLYTFYCSLEMPVYPVFSIDARSEGGGATQMRVLPTVCPVQLV